MKVAELCVTLQARRMSKNGLNAVMADQLKTAGVESVAIIQDRLVTEIENSAGNVLHPSAYWKELK